MSHTIDVPISYQKDYRIHIGNDIWDHIIEFSSDTYAQRLAFVVIDEQVHRLHFDKISRERSGKCEQVEAYVVQEGERRRKSRQWRRNVDLI
jgi:3-dehydroquinate synthetase